MMPAESKLSSLIFMILIACNATAYGRSHGDAADGKRIFDAKCGGCHAPEYLAGHGNRVVNDLRAIDPAMFPVGILTDQEVDSLDAYLDSLIAE